MRSAGSTLASRYHPGIKTPILCIIEISYRSALTENHTPELALRIRLKTLPAPGDFDEFDLSHFRPGETYVVPSHLASLLIISGYAELVDEHPRQAEAADFGHPRFPKRP